MVISVVVVVSVIVAGIIDFQSAHFPCCRHKSRTGLFGIKAFGDPINGFPDLFPNRVYVVGISSWIYIFGTLQLQEELLSLAIFRK